MEPNLSDDLTHYMDATERMRQRAEAAEAERDLLQDDLASIGFAVAASSGRTGVIEHYEIVDLVRAVVAERDRLRAGIMTAEVHGEMIVRMRESVWLHAEAERDRLRDELEAVRPQFEAHVRMLTVAVEELAAERDRLRAVVDAAITDLREIGEHLDGHPVEQVIRRLRRALDGSEATDG